jgi:hypothetical protein
MNCTNCSHPTNRHDGLCLNCFHIGEKDVPYRIFEESTIRSEKYVCACGEKRPAALILMQKGPYDGHAGFAPCNNSARVRDHRCQLVGYDPTGWFARCYNCQQARYKRPPGRPCKLTHEEREWNRKNATAVWRAHVNTRVVQSYGENGKWPECSACMMPATKVLYVGEFGKGPSGKDVWRCRKMAIDDPYWHAQYAPYCDSHQPRTLPERKAEKKRRIQESMHNEMAAATRDLMLQGINPF